MNKVTFSNAENVPSYLSYTFELASKTHPSTVRGAFRDKYIHIILGVTITIVTTTIFVLNADLQLLNRTLETATYTT